MTRVFLGPISVLNGEKSEIRETTTGFPACFPRDGVDAAEHQPTIHVEAKDEKVPVVKQIIPRPPNAFILFRRDMAKIFARESPETANNTICEYQAQ